MTPQEVWTVQRQSHLHSNGTRFCEGRRGQAVCPSLAQNSREGRWGGSHGDGWRQNLVNAPSLRAQGGGLEKRISQLFPNTQNRLLAGTSVWVANLRILVPQPQKQIQITPKVHIQSWKENGCFRFGAGWCLHASLSRDISKSFYSVSSYNCHSCHSHKSQGGWCK